LALTGLRLSGEPLSLFPFRSRHLWLGLVSAFVLYGIFWIGKEASSALLPFASREISSIYLIRTQLNALAIGLLVFFVMGPAEEIYWHGFVQRSLSRRLGPLVGALLNSAIYGLIHGFAMNVMLVLAAAICGLFWGWLYQREGSLIPVILSHSVRDVMIFVIFPIH
jgi:membrane protease YdiL (CAAX protease family)